MNWRSVVLAALLAPASADFEDNKGGKCIEAVVASDHKHDDQLASASSESRRRRRTPSPPPSPPPTSRRRRTPTGLQNGDKLAVRDCVYLDRQKMMFHPEYTSGQIRLVSGKGKHKQTMCLDASDMQVGTFIQVWECVGNEQQTWTYDAQTKAFSLKSRSGFCLDLPGADASSSDSRLWVWECNGQSSQSWVYDHTRLGLFDLYAPIVYGDAFACVRAPWDNGASGALLAAENCAETTSKLSDGERWMLGDDWFPEAWNRQSYYGPLRLKADQSKCMDGAGMSEGEAVWLWECNGEKQQNWDFDPKAFRMYLADSDPKVCLERGDSGLSVQLCSNDQPLQRWIVDRQPTFDEIRACPSCQAPSLIV